MVRHFTGEPVGNEALDRILELARRGPSAGFSQGQDFIVISDAATRSALARLCGEDAYTAKGFHPFISGAPVLIVPCTNEAAYHRRYREPDKLRPDGGEIEWPVPYWYMDIGCAVMTLLLGAVNEGLAAAFAGFHDPDGVRDLLGIPEEVVPVGAVPIGHPAPDRPSPSLARRRRARAAVIHHGRW